jgi:hypothetical protein
LTQDQENEKFIHLRACIRTLNNAWRILQELRDGNAELCSATLVGAAFQFALVEYSKPYLKSRGEEVPNHVLDERFIPSHHLGLHQRIVEARNQIHAHSDITVMGAKLYVKNAPSGKIVGSVQNIIHGTEEYPNLEAIIELIEQTLDNMYVEEKVIEQRLPITS